MSRLPQGTRLSNQTDSIEHLHLECLKLSSPQLSKVTTSTKTGCEDHKHSMAEGPHKAREILGGGYSFANGDCQLIGKDGKVVLINRLHAASMSLFLSTALLNAKFPESGKKMVHLPLFTSNEIVDAIEMSNWVIHQWLEHHRIPDIHHLSFHCGINLLRIAAFFQFDHLLKALEKFIEKQITPENLIQAYRIAQVTDAKLAQRLWLRILTDFALLCENNSFAYLSPEEINECFNDSKLNIKWIYDKDVLREYKRLRKVLLNADSHHEEIDQYLGTERFGAFGTQNQSRIPQSVIIAHAGWTSIGTTKKVDIYDYHREKWLDDIKVSLEEEKSRAYHGLTPTSRGILCMGGFNGRNYFRSTAFLDFNTCQWKPVCAMVEPRCYLGMEKIDDDNIIAAGGSNGQSRLRTAEIYNFEENQWLKAGSMSIVRSDACAASLTSLRRVYMVGGFDGKVCHRTVEYYVPERDQWIIERGLMHSKRTGVGAVGVLNNIIIAIAGFDGTHRLPTTEMFDVREGIWHELSDLNIPRSNFGNTVLEGEPWVMGGYSTDQTTAECERFDMKLNRWIVMPSLNTSRSAVACCTVSNIEWIDKIIDSGDNVLIGDLRTSTTLNYS